MKIAYFLYWLDSPESGVMKKIADQAAAWKDQGHAVKLIVSTLVNSPLARQQHQLEKLFPEAYFIFIYRSLPEWLIKSFQVFREIRKFSPDLVYLRDCKYTLGIAKTLKSFPSIMEINSNDLNEMSRTSAGYYYAKLFQRFLYRHVDGFVPISYELSGHHPFGAYNKPYKVIGNAIDFNRNPWLPPPFNKNEINLVFIGTAHQRWHGTDEILRFSELKPEWDFHIIGTSTDVLVQEMPVRPNVKFYGILDKEKYLEIFKRCDIAIGTMALYRINENETSPLKVREYLCCGLPVINGYKDVDFLEKTDFILELPNHEHNMVDHIKEIEEFVNRWKGKRVDRELVKHLDVTVKESERLAFFEAIVQDSKKSNKPN